MHIARVNGTAKSARRENAREAPDKAERPRSLGPARAAARRKGPQTAANRTGSSNPARFLFYIKDLLAVQAVRSEPVSGAGAVISLLNREKTGNFCKYSLIGPYDVR